MGDDHLHCLTNKKIIDVDLNQLNKIKKMDAMAGGTFALYSLICRGANVSLLPNQQVEDRELSFYKLQMPSRQLERALKLKRALENSHCAKTSLLFMALLGTCMVIGDGVLTPAISGKNT